MKQQEAEPLREAILASVPPDLAPESSAMLQGERYFARISAMELESFANKKRARRYLGAARFFELARITLKDLKEALTSEQYERTVHTERTGARDIETLRRPAA